MADPVLTEKGINMTRDEMISLIHDRLEHADLRELEMICGLVLVAGAVTRSLSIQPTTAPHENKSKQELTLSVPDAAKRLGVPVSTMYEIVKTKGFPTIHIGTRILVSAKGLEEWVDKKAREE